jgi:hypothetical protein
MSKRYSIEGRVKIFPQKGGWHYVAAPAGLARSFKARADRGLVAVTAFVGKTGWPTSLLPKGDGTLFVALPERVRRLENVRAGGRVRVDFVLRER